jgi:hypothetical protein
MVFAIGCFGSDNLNPTPLACEFKDTKGEELDSSPWFHDAMMEFLCAHGGKEGFVYRFEGTFRNYEFKGKIVPVYEAK